MTSPKDQSPFPTPDTEADIETEVGGRPSMAPRASDPQRIGPFRILGRLGSGGMGTVFLGEQTAPVRRRVAVKIMRGLFLDPEARARFEAERQAMARLQHPNVAQIFAADATEDGHPYFAMEHVKGDDIVKFCDRERLDLEQRLELFRQVCASVQHAHQKGIIHRDLKPSNVLVTRLEGRPVPKIIDFGVAKTLDEPLTRLALETGDRLIGTPAYLSPEAAGMGAAPGAERLDVDTRSDVYSLGILLYELLVGQRPFDEEGTGVLRILHRVAVEEPTRPSARWSGLDLSEQEVTARRRHLEPAALRKSLRGDLDWIVLKAIAKDRDRRYGSAAELADDLRRYLGHEPVLASPPSRLYQARKLMRRRRGTVVAALLLVLAVVTGFVARTVEAARANREAAAAVQARQEAEKALVDAERAKQEADQVSRFLLDLFSVSDPGKARGNTVTARELLDDAAERIQDELAEQPVTKARLLHTMADVYRKLGLYERSGALYDQSLALRRSHLPADHGDLVQSLSGKGSLLAMSGRPEAALPFFEEAVRALQSAPDTKIKTLAVALGNLGTLYLDLGREDEGEARLLEAAELAESYEGPPVAGLMPIFNNLGVLYQETDRPAEAERLFRLFVERQRALVGDEDHPWVAFGLANLANTRHAQGHSEEALDMLDGAVTSLRQIYGTPHPEVGSSLLDRVEILSALGQAELARRQLETARGDFVELPADHPYRQRLERLASEL